MATVRIGVVALCVLWAALFAIAQATIAGVDRYYPMALCGTLFVLTVWLALGTFRTLSAENGPPDDLRRVGLSIALYLAYILAWNVTGYLTATFVFLVLLLCLLGERKPLVVAGIPLATVAVLYIVFYRLVVVPFPQGAIGL